MQIQSNFSLQNHNTFGMKVLAKTFVEVTNVSELKAILEQHEAIFILGGGSNMLLTKDIDKLVVFINLKGKKIIKETEDFIWIEANAGENWHEFVLWCIENNYGGVENLSLIPGNVGTTPIQNIGAYGVEIKDIMYSCEALHIENLETKTFFTSDCHFEYRESVFKKELKNQYIIISVTFQLTKKNHQLHTHYGAIDKELQSKNLEPTIKNISDTVIAIRQSKLPDPKILGNSGSFFKNPIISESDFVKISEKHPNLPFYKMEDNSVKIPAGWLIEQAGYKGKRIGDAGVHQNQALVLVNYGTATGEEIYTLSKEVQQAVLEQFGIEIEAEVNII